MEKPGRHHQVRGAGARGGHPRCVRRADVRAHQLLAFGRIRGIRAGAFRRSVSFRYLRREQRGWGSCFVCVPVCVPVVAPGRRRSPGRVTSRLRCLVALPRSRRPAQPRPSPGRAWSSRPVPSSPACRPVPSSPACRPAQPCLARAASAGCVFSQGHVPLKTSFGTASSLRRGIPRRWRNATWGFASASFREDASRDAEWCQTVDFAAYQIGFRSGAIPLKRRYGGSDRFFAGDVAFGNPAPNLARPGVTSRVARLGARRHPSALQCNIAGKPCNGRAERFCADRWHDGGSEVEQRKSNGFGNLDEGSVAASRACRARSKGFPRSDVRSVNKSESIGLPNRPIAATKRGFRRQIGIDGC